MSRSNQILGRILLGSAIGGLLGLLLLAMGIAVVLHALSGRSNDPPAVVEIEATDPAERPLGDGYALQDQTFDEAQEDQAGDAAYGPMGPAYPGEGENPPPVALARPAEPLPPAVRGQWRSIFEEDAPVAPTPPTAATPPAAPTARPAPRPTPRNQPQPNRDEESLFY